MNDNCFAARMAGHLRLTLLRYLVAVPTEEAARRLILGALTQATGWSASLEMLQEELLASSLTVSLEEVVAAVEWLAARGLVATQRGADGLAARLTRPGIEALTGVVRLPGLIPPPTVAELRDVLEGAGLRVTVETVGEACAWLADHHLVSIGTESGEVWPRAPMAWEVATGRRQVEGIAMPDGAGLLRQAGRLAAASLRGGA